MMHKPLALIFLTLFLKTSYGLNCYVCSMSESDTSDLCVTSPTAISGSNSMECNLRYCTIRRQEYRDVQGRIASFYRGCENNPVHLNTMVDSDDFRTYYRACTSDLCNTGNGIQTVISSQGSGSNLITLLVQGTGVSSSHLHMPQVTMICFTLLASLLLRNIIN